jgi:hypothetical protein
LADDGHSCITGWLHLWCHHRRFARAFHYTEEGIDTATLPTLRFDTSPPPIVPLTDSMDNNLELARPSAKIGKNIMSIKLQALHWL